LRHRSRRAASLVPNYIILSLLVMGFNSLKDNAEIARNPLGPPREGLHWANFPADWEAGEYSVSLRNSAASLIMILLIVVLFLSLQRQFIKGLTEGGLKT